MIIFPLHELSIIKEIDAGLFEKIVSKSKLNADIHILVEIPKGYELRAIDEGNVVFEGPAYVKKIKRNVENKNAHGKKVNADFASVDVLNLIENIEKKSKINAFCEAFERTSKKSAKKNSQSNHGDEVRKVKLDSTLVIFGGSKSSGESGQKKLSFLRPEIKDLYIGIDEELANNPEYIKEYIGIFDQIPIEVMEKLKRFPEFDEKEFHDLAILKNVYQDSWPDFIEKWATKKVYASREEEVDAYFFENFPAFDDVYDEIRREIKRIRRKADKELVEKFNDGSASYDSKDGVSRGNNSSSIASKIIEPHFIFDSGKRIRRTGGGATSVKLRILFELKKIIWEKVEKDNPATHPTNKFVGMVLLSINRDEESLKFGDDKNLVLAMRDCFYESFPEIRYFPDVTFPKADCETAAGFIRPNWAYSRQKGDTIK